MKIIERLTELHFMIAKSSLTKQEYEKISNRIVEIKKEFDLKNYHVQPEDIIKEVGKYYKMPEDYYIAKTRQHEYVLARQVAMTILTEKTKYSKVDIGKFFDRDHSTVIHAQRTIHNLIETDRTIMKDYNIVENIINIKFIENG